MRPRAAHHRTTSRFSAVIEPLEHRFFLSGDPPDGQAGEPDYGGSGGISAAALTAPALLSPGVTAAPGNIVLSTIPTFKWRPVPGADGYGLYIREMNPDGSPGPLVFNSTNIGGPIAATSYRIPAGYLQAGKRYRWNVNAHHPADGYSTNYASPWYFHIDAAAPAEPSGIAWVPSPYFTSRGGTAIDSIVIHTAEGSYSGTISWFQNNPSSVSAHYVISPSGQITRMVALENRAHHATYYNSRSIGIEMAGFAAQASTWNENNMRALEALVAWLVHRYRIPAVRPPGDARTYPDCRYDEPGLVAHSQVQPSTSCNGFATKSDPGPHFDWTRFIRNVTARAGGLPGDANLDGRIDVGDYFAIDQGGAQRLSGWAGGDFNFSGNAASASDYMLIDRSFLKEVSMGTSASASAPAPITIAPDVFAAKPIEPDGPWDEQGLVL